MILFVSGNDTNIGKTFVSSLLIESISRKYNKIAYIKPIESGVLRASNSDFAYVKKFNNFRNVDFFQFESFKEPVAPLTASILEKKDIDYSQIVKKIRQLEKNYDLLVVEGAGGLRVPITKSKEVVDLIKSIKARVLLVATPYLGTLNHTFMSIEVLKSRNISFEGVILNFYPKNPNISELHNPILINSKRIKILGVIPKISKISLKTNNYKLNSFFSHSLGGKFSDENFIKKIKKKFEILTKKYTN